jgi:hypothetical protein
MRVFLGGLHLSGMNPAVMFYANKSLPFSLYDFHLAGVPARELAAAHSLPIAWVEERIEAVRLCLEYQVRLSVAPAQAAKPLAHYRQ